MLLKTLIGMAGAAFLLSAMPASAQNGCWTYDNCAAKCRRHYSRMGMQSVWYCIDQGVPCSRFPKTCGGPQVKGFQKRAK